MVRPGRGRRSTPSNAVTCWWTVPGHRLGSDADRVRCGDPLPGRPSAVPGDELIDYVVAKSECLLGTGARLAESDGDNAAAGGAVDHECRDPRFANTGREFRFRDYWPPATIRSSFAVTGLP